MNRLMYVFIVLMMVSLIPAHAANGADEAHVTLVETFGLATAKEEGKYRVIAFIPRTFLLFDIDKEEPDLKVGEEYLAATTQDGVRVFLLEENVSKDPFKEKFGGQDIIFNNSYLVCLKKLHCNQLDNEQVLKINAGEVFKSEALHTADGEGYKLVGNRDAKKSVDDEKEKEEVTGYIHEDKLEMLNHKSVVTYATRTHPRYKVTSSEAKSINTSCGESIKKNQRKNVGLVSDTDETLISAFPIAAIGGRDNQLLQFKRAYGGTGKAFVYKLYDVIDRRTNSNSKTTYAAKIVYRCDENNIRQFIESLVIINTADKSPIILKPEGTPEGLRKFTGAPYLYSVNNSEQYFQLMDKLSEQFEESRALAGYFLAVFNRSCKGKLRKKKKACQHSAYEDTSNTSND